MDDFNLLDQYEIIKADNEEWARYHAIYRLSKINEWMPLSFQGEINRYLKIDWCYWIMKNHKRVGGALIKQNMIKCIFTIPPFDFDQELINKLVLYVDSISDKSKPIIVPDVEQICYKYYEQAGFKFQRVEKLMVCATNDFDVDWDAEYTCVVPNEQHAEEMAQLYYETYSKSKVTYIAEQTYDFQVNSVDVYFKHRAAVNASSDWSTLIYDNKSNKLIAACTVGLVNGLPYILDFVVQPQFQKKGLASKMMKSLLNITHKQYPAIRLCITEGNDAEIFYKKLGFIGLAKKGYFEKVYKQN